MKTIELIEVAALLMAVSCNKTADVPAEAIGAGSFEKGATTLTVNVRGGQTKADSEFLETLANEDALVKNFQIVTYDLDNSGNAGEMSGWYNKATVGGATSFTTTILPGNKRFLFVCNQAPFSTTLHHSWSSRVNLLTDSRTSITAQHLPLGLGFDSPYYDLEVVSGTPLNLNIQMVHMCSRIVLCSIVNEMQQDARIESITGKSISLLNVPKGLMMDGTVQETPYYNPKGGDYSTAEKCSIDSVQGAGPRSFAEISYDEYDDMIPACVYAYPGANMYLCVALDILFVNDLEPVTCYYAVPLSGLEQNKTYDVTLRVRNVGSQSPQNPTISSSGSFSVTVSPWEAATAIDQMM